jgi:hypothetical protein
MSFRERIEAFVADVRAKSADGFTLGEISDLFFDFVDLAVEEAKALQLPGADKKAHVMAAVEYFYDTVAPFIPLGFLSPVRFLIRPVVKKTILAIADRLIERVLKRPPPVPSPT